MIYQKNDVPYIYAFIYYVLRQRTKDNPYVSLSFIKEWVKRICRNIPSLLCVPIINQMEEYKLIKRIHKRRYEILKHNCYHLIEGMKDFSFW